MLQRTVLMRIIVVSVILISTQVACGEDVFDKAPPSLFTDKRALEVGDIVTILLMEHTSGSNEAMTNSNFEHSLEAKNAATDFLDFLPGLGLDAGVESDQKAKGLTSRQGSLKGKISARVVEVLPNGMLRLEGQRSVEVNGEKQITILNGLVRPSDVRANNTVYSYNIADASITYRGKGVIDQASKPGILSRIINWLF